MKTPSKDLFSLIKSLTKSEKKSLGIRSNSLKSRRESINVKLFEAVDRQKEYDEEALKRIPGVKYFAESKQYLYENICDHLLTVKSYKSYDDEITRHMHLSEVLISKKLPELAEKHLAKAYKLSRKAERFSLLSIVISKQIAFEKYYTKTDPAALENLYKEKLDVLRIEANFIEFENIKNRLLMLHGKNYVIRSKEELNNLKKMFGNERLLKSEKMAESEMAKLFYHDSKALYDYLTLEHREALRSFIRVAEIYERNPVFMRIHFIPYILSLVNILNAASITGDYAAFNTASEKIESLVTDELKSRGVIIFYKNVAKFKLEVEAQNTAEAGKLVESLKAGMEEISGKMNKFTEIETYLYFVKYYILTGDYDEALKWNNYLLNDFDLEISESINCHVRFFNLIIHLEMGNYELISYKLNSVLLYLNKRNKLYKFEKALLNFIRSLIKKENLTDIKFELGIFKRELEKIRNDKFERAAFDHFDYLNWVNLKLGAGGSQAKIGGNGKL